MSSVDHIRYDLLAQEALRGVVRRVLVDAARDGLPGDHHFYISFDTRAPGVRLSTRMREKYPEEMTIVLQHQFWDLNVTEHAFEVGLSFGGVPERLLVPFTALKGFFDPSVKFGLQFEIAEAEASEEPAPEEDNSAAAPTPLPTASPIRSIRGAASEPALASARKADGEAEKVTAKNEPAKEQSGEDKPQAGAEVVRLDVFRKK
ncbi:Stringent starvation protein B [Aquabacter sp. L1I39]|uniref:SspB family protein n=1 Tax=Aquabacter sp. L1I39 TaxID=2820278 RepID=UPI001AD9F613|nr:ClpXP protease specificity-enhancing factor SspB [Aquabacter sp. L1I39]QTL05056.1 Stringent starvation protein B [Aquabacter sp. L1I39]